MTHQLHQDSQNGSRKRSPWLWVPSLYYAEGIPYAIVVYISVIMYKRLGISNAEIALYTSWLYLPWVIKPFWSPIVDIFRTKRFWILSMQLLLGACMASLAFTIPLPNFFQLTLAIFWLLAFSSATHDIAADGFYMLGLSQHQQAWFVGVRSTFYRFAMLTGQGLLVILAGYIESHSGMDSVSLNVTATQPIAIEQEINGELAITVRDEPLSIIMQPTSLQIPIMERSKAEIDSLVAEIKSWNAKQGQEVEKKASGSSQSGKKPGLWGRNVSEPLAGVIRSAFGVQKKATEGPALAGAGNVGIVSFQLSGAPKSGKPVVVSFGRQTGDKSINLVEGMRFKFTEDNWNKPARALIQLDSKLKGPAEAQFIARGGNIPLSWMLTFLAIAAIFILFFIYHRFILPSTGIDVNRTAQNFNAFLREYGRTFVLFFKKEKIWVILAFLLLYRLGEAQLVKLASPFLLDSQEAGGLALTTGQVGFVYGTVGLAMLSLGGILGGFVVARDGLKRWIWWMAIAINLPDTVYIYMAHTMPNNFLVINICVAIEQFGYGFGFTAYMLYMIYVSEGEYKTAHFAITTGFMGLGMMLPGMISGWIQQLVGYTNFFIWVLIATIPGIVIIKFLPIDPGFGKKKSGNS